MTRSKRFDDDIRTPYQIGKRSEKNGKRGTLARKAARTAKYSTVSVTA